MIAHKNKLPREKAYPFLVFAVAALFAAAFILIAKLPFFSDDYSLLYHAGKNPFPFFSDWVTTGTGMLRPLVIVSLAVQMKLHGLQPQFFYLFNLLTHTATSFFVYQCLAIILPRHFRLSDTKIPLVLSLCFFFSVQSAVNVLWISGRTDLLCGFFGFLALWMHLTPLRMPAVVRTLLVPVLIFLSLLSKETGLLFPLLLGIEVVCNRQTEIRKKLPTLIAVAAAVGLYFIFRLLAFGSFIPQAPGEASVFQADFWFKGLLNLFSPFDIIELRNGLIRGSVYGFWAGVLSLFLFIYALIAIIKLYNGKQLFFAACTVLISAVSLLIYSRNYPELRLMYILVPLTLPLFALTINAFTGKSRILFMVILFIAIITGSFTEYSAALKQAKDYEKLQHAVRNINEDDSTVYVCIPYLSHIANRFSYPALELAAPYWRTGTVNTISSQFAAVLPYTTYSLTEETTKISCRQVDSLSFEFRMSSGRDGFVVHENKAGEMKTADTESGMIKSVSFSDRIPHLHKVARRAMVQFNPQYLKTHRVKFIFPLQDSMHVIDPFSGRFK
ncbi:MAG: hypothetical protein HYV28_11210 [Ignavibacteriales bacterium]|nr:hypothetical protein [Ignavibacteriales bacterium]